MEDGEQGGPEVGLSRSELEELLERVERSGGWEGLGEREVGRWAERLAEEELDEAEEDSDTGLLFRVAQALLAYKAAEAEALNAEVARSRQTAEEALAEQRRSRDELSKLREGQGSEMGLQDVLEEKERAEEARDEAIRDLDELREELLQERARKEKLFRQVEEMEDRHKEKTAENLGLQSRVDELNKVIAGKRGGRSSEEATRKLRERSEQLSKVVDECNRLAEANGTLMGQVEELRDRLGLASEEMERTTSNFEEMKERLITADALIPELERENERLRAAAGEEVAEGPAATGEPEAALAVALGEMNERIEKWKELLGSRDAEAEAMRVRNAALEAEMAALSQDSDKASVATLSKALEDRDAQLEGLKRLLETGRDEMEETRHLAEALRLERLEAGGEGETAQEAARRMERQVAQAQETEREARETAEAADKERSALIARLRAYESGVFGLPEAVEEARQANVQLHFRDKQIRSLQQRCSEAIATAHEVMEENAELRARLGLPLASDKARPALKRSKLKRSAEAETDRALNLILQREVEKLEDERVELKLELRKLSRAVGERAEELGLEPEDILALGELREELKLRRQGLVTDWDAARQKAVASLFPDQVAGGNAANQYSAGGSIFAEDRPMTDARADESTQVAELRGKESGLKTSLDAALDRLALEQRKVFQLEEELSQAQKHKPEARLDDGPIQLTGPGEASSAAVLALSRRLVAALGQVETLEGELREAEKALSGAASEAEALKALERLAAEHAEAQKAWEAERDGLRRRLETMEELETKSQIQVQEYEHYLETQSRSPEEREVRLAEMSRKFLTMRIQDALLRRRAEALDEELRLARSLRLAAEAKTAARERSVRVWAAAAHQHRQVAASELDAAQARLQDSVSAEQHRAVQAQLEDLAQQHSRLLHQQMVAMDRAKLDTDLHAQLADAEAELAHLRKLLQTEKDKCVRLEAVSSVPAGSTLSGQEELEATSQRVAVLEMAELEWREKAEKANHLAQRREAERRKAEEEVKEAETKIEKLQLLNLELSGSEAAAQEKLARCVPPEVARATEERLREAEKALVSSQSELDGLRSVAEVAEDQSAHWRRVERRREAETHELRRALLDLGAETQHKAIIARLYRELIQLKIERVESEEDNIDGQRKLDALEVRHKRLERRNEGTERQLWRTRRESEHRVNSLRGSLAQLRVRFAGSVGLSEQTKLHRLMEEATAGRQRLRAEALEAEEARHKLSLQLEECELRRRGLDELLETLREQPAAQLAKVRHWHEELERLRLDEMRERRTLEKVRLQLDEAARDTDRSEEALEAAEARLAAALREKEAAELDWEQRELDLQRRLAVLEGAQSEEDALIGVQDELCSLPDQLHRTQLTLRAQIRTNNQLRQENVALEKAKEAALVAQQKAELTLKNRLSEQVLSAATLASRLGGESHHERAEKGVGEVVEGLKGTMEILRSQLSRAEAEAEAGRSKGRALEEEMAEAERRHLEELGRQRDEASRALQDQLGRLRQSSDAFLARSLAQDPVFEDQLLREAQLSAQVTELSDALHRANETIAELRRDLAKAAVTDERVLSGSQRSRDLLLSQKTPSEEDAPGLPPPFPTSDAASLPSSPALSSPAKSSAVPDHHKAHHGQEEDSSLPDTSSQLPLHQSPKKEPSRPAKKATQPSEHSKTPEAKAALEWKVESQRLSRSLANCRSENKKLKDALSDLASGAGARRVPDRAGSVAAESELQRRLLEAEAELGKARKREDALKQERSSLSAKAERLERQLRTTQRAEKPLDSLPSKAPKKPAQASAAATPDTAAAQPPAFQQWKKVKEAQGQIEQLRGRLSEKEAALATSQLQKDRLNDRIHKLQEQVQQLLSERVSQGPRSSAKSTKTRSESSHGPRQARPPTSSSERRPRPQEASPDQAHMRRLALKASDVLSLLGREAEREEAPERLVEKALAAAAEAIAASDQRASTEAERAEELEEQVHTLQSELDRAIGLAEAGQARPGTLETVNAQAERIEALEAELREVREGLEGRVGLSHSLSDAHLKDILAENAQLKRRLSKVAPRVDWAPPGFVLDVAEDSRAIRSAGAWRAGSSQGLSQPLVAAGTSTTTATMTTMSTTRRLRSHSSETGGGGGLGRRRGSLEAQLLELAEANHRLRYERQSLGLKLKALETADADPPQDAAECSLHIRQLTLRAIEAEEEREELRRRLSVAEAGGVADAAGLHRRLAAHQRLLRENLDLRLRLGAHFVED